MCVCLPPYLYRLTWNSAGEVDIGLHLHIHPQSINPSITMSTKSTILLPILLLTLRTTSAESVTCPYDVSSFFCFKEPNESQNLSHISLYCKPGIFWDFRNFRNNSEMFPKNFHWLNSAHTTLTTCTVLSDS